jgi:hypothetical protein
MLSAAPGPAVIVNNTARPPGRNAGKRWSDSPRAVSGFVSTFTSPPPAGTLNNPVDVSAVANTIVSFGPQVAPRGGVGVRHNVTGGPPVTDTLRSSFVPTANPIHLPSGDQNGVLAFAKAFPLSR